jgi:methylglutaconyl-CoA hydratase
VPKIQLDEEVARYADLLLRGAPGALTMTKTVLREANSMPFAAELARMAEISAARFASEEAREGMAAFAEKREPGWAARPAQQAP